MAAIRRTDSDHPSFEFPDLQAEFFALDCFGQLIALAGERCLAIVDLTNPTEVAACVHRNHWQLTSIQWNPHPSESHSFLLANGKTLELWSWKTLSLNTPTKTCKAHLQTISDVVWSPVDSNMAATCSMDAFTHLWDIRTLQLPVLTLEALIGASHVRWSKSNLLVTSHDGDLRVWDPRKSSSAVHYITGHRSKINGVDWSPYSDCRFASCSHDGVVKLWDISQPKKVEEQLTTTAPVWRVKYTPFGRGLATADLPLLDRRESVMLLWSLTSHNDSVNNNSKSLQPPRQPIQAFAGFSDMLLDIQWRQPEADGHEILAWSRDQVLHIWPIDPYVRQLCEDPCDLDTETVSLDKSLTDELSSVPSLVCDSAYVPPLQGAGTKPPSSNGGVASHGNSNGANSNNHSGKASKSSTASQQHPKTLDQEFVLLNFDIPNVTIFGMNHVQRLCKVTATCGLFEVHLTMHFPDEYPNNAVPSFILTGETNVDDTTQSKLIKVLHNTALQHVRHNRSCIEPCLRQLVNCLESLKQEDSLQGSPDTPPHFSASRKTSMTVRTPSFLSTYSIEFLRNESVPFPRTSGARFCGGGYLVCFTRRIIEVHRDQPRAAPSTADLLTPTPRAMSALSALQQSARGAQLAPSTNRGYTSYTTGVLARSLPSDSSVPSVSQYYNSNYQRHQQQQQQQPAKTSLKTARSGDSNLGRTASDANVKYANSTKRQHLVTGPVVVYNIFCLLPVDKQLAADYVFESDSVSMCERNAKIADGCNRTDLVQMWNLAKLCCEQARSGDADQFRPWPLHSFGRPLVESLFKHYSVQKDVQTLAMLCCVFGSKPRPSIAPALPPPTPVRPPPAPSPAADIAQPGTDGVVWLIDSAASSYTSVSKIRRSNSWSDAFEEPISAGDVVETIEGSKDEEDTDKDSSCLPAMFTRLQYDKFIKVYSNILYQFGLHKQRADLMKYLEPPPRQRHSGLEVVPICNKCRRECHGADSVRCSSCNTLTIKCSICRMFVKGLCSVCLLCYHGGHVTHVTDWFLTHFECPTGCGCHCLFPHNVQQQNT